MTNSKKSVYIEKDTHKKLAKLSFDHDVPMQDIANALLNAGLKDTELVARIIELLKA